MKNEKNGKSPAFIADAHLGKVARYLRFAGFDTLFDPQRTGEALRRWAIRENRILLTRSHRLPSDHTCRIEGSDLKKALTELARCFPLEHHYRPFTRCTLCNAPLHPADKARLPASVPGFVKEHFSEFRRCPHCDKIYWKGSHYRRTEERWRRIFRHASPGTPDPTDG